MKLIKQFESCELKAYKCPAGVWTIGYGYTHNVKEGDEITQSEADNLLKTEIKKIERQINALDLSLKENEKQAIISFVYNVGIGNFTTSSLLKKIRRNCTDQEAVQEFIKWIYADGKQLKGLLARRIEEAKLFIGVGSL